ncbi:hypothetical protein STTU_4346 [Streptomyces sp. Tu6071]|nr:hypothetical protein STTU_4346 [Streptomyces sp. Tu6071]
MAGSLLYGCGTGRGTYGSTARRPIIAQSPAPAPRGFVPLGRCGRVLRGRRDLSGETPGEPPRKPT